MQISLVTPAPPASRAGNRNTAVRWARLLRQSGHRVRICTQWQPAATCALEAGASTELLLALHARRSHESIVRFRAALPHRPIVLVLTGTDVYRDIIDDRQAQRSLQLADRLVVLQPRALDELSTALRARAHVVIQSAPAAPAVEPLRRSFELCVVGHLRDEKDPLCAARALPALVPPLLAAPLAARLRITQVGRALDPDLESEARAAMRADRRYRWLGEVAPWRARRLIARSRAMIISSRMEGGANVVSEAIAAGTPVLASHIPGNLGLLGDDWPACYPVGDASALARLIARFSTDPAFRAGLQRAIDRLAGTVHPDQERAALDSVIAAAAAGPSIR